MDRPDIRELCYFAAVAEELHFGRAAERLGIAQPPLSRTIARLERRMGVRLLDRDSRHVSLTRAGEVFLTESRRALEAMDAAVLRAQRAAEPEPRLVLVMKAGGDSRLLPGILARFEADPAAVPVEVTVCSAHERAAMLRDGRADVGLLQRPTCDLTGLDSEDLLTEQQVAVLPHGHPLAERATLSMADLDGEPLVYQAAVPETSPGPVIRDAAQLMQLIALGHMVAVLPASVHGHLRDDLTCVPITDAVPTTLVVAWPAHRRSAALSAFVQAANAEASTPTRIPDIPL